MLNRFAELRGHAEGRYTILLQAALLISEFRIKTWLFPFQKLVAPLDQGDGKEPTDLDSEQQSLVKDIKWAIGAIARRYPFGCSCLVQVLAAQRMLQSRGIPGEFFLGAVKNDSPGPGLHAHAWLLSGGTFITGESGHDKYRVLARYRWD